MAHEINMNLFWLVPVRNVYSPGSFIRPAGPGGLLDQ